MKVAIFLLATLACIGFSLASPAPAPAYPVGYAQSGSRQQAAYYPAVQTVVEEDYSDEEEQPARGRGRLTYRRKAGAQGNRLQLKDGGYVQYGNDRRWNVYPRTRDETQHSSSSQWRARVPGVPTTTPVPTRLPPRLMLKSGDNVHFGEGINWSIYKTDAGLTRVGTRDGEVVVRVVRPNYEDRSPPPTTTQRPETTTQYQWRWDPCYTEQECYRQYVNEYYRFYANNQ